jgi:hypothetical protein
MDEHFPFKGPAPILVMDGTISNKRAWSRHEFKTLQQYEWEMHRFWNMHEVYDQDDDNG